MVYIPTLIGEIGTFIFNIIVLILLVKYDLKIKSYNERHPIKKQQPKKIMLSVYFIIWIIVSFVAWYVLNFVQLGEYFAIGVVTPVVIVLLLEWLEIVR